MRPTGVSGGIPDPFDAAGAESAGPSGFVVAIWSSVAGMAMLMALVASLYGLPDRNDATREAQAEVPANVDPITTGAIGQSGGEIGVIARSDPRSAALNDDMAYLRTENAALRQLVGQLRGRVDDLSQRLATLEERFGDTTGSVTPTVPLPATRPGGSLPPMPDVEGGLTRDEPTVSRTLFGAEIGAYADLRSVNTAWRRLRSEKPDLFAGLSASVTLRDREGRTELLLIAGPFRNAAEAAALCVRANGADLSCLPAFWIGQPLATE